MGDLLNLLKNNRWGLVALGAAGTAVIAAGVVDPASTEAQAFGGGAIALVVIGGGLLLKKLMAKGGTTPPAA